jgi:hypothetical protein
MRSGDRPVTMVKTWFSRAMRSETGVDSPSRWDLCEAVPSDLGRIESGLKLRGGARCDLGQQRLCGAPPAHPFPSAPSGETLDFH